MIQEYIFPWQDGDIGVEIHFVDNPHVLAGAEKVFAENAKVLSWGGTDYLVVENCIIEERITEWSRIRNSTNLPEPFHEYYAKEVPSFWVKKDCIVNMYQVKEIPEWARIPYEEARGMLYEQIEEFEAKRKQPQVQIIETPDKKVPWYKKLLDWCCEDKNPVGM